MRVTTKTILAIGLAGLFSGTVMAARLPPEIYQPRHAEVVKADRQGNGEFEAEFRLNANKISVQELADRVTAHARAHGFRIEEREIDYDDADLKFRRGDQELDVSIELKDKRRIEYKADLDLDRD